METLRWLAVLFILALAVVPHRAKRHRRENSAHLAINLAFVALGLAIVLLAVGK